MITATTFTGKHVAERCRHGRFTHLRPCLQCEPAMVPVSAATPDAQPLTARTPNPRLCSWCDSYSTHKQTSRCPGTAAHTDFACDVHTEEHLRPGALTFIGRTFYGPVLPL